jgi:hypothetical protein
MAAQPSSSRASTMAGTEDSQFSHNEEEQECYTPASSGIGADRELSAPRERSGSYATDQSDLSYPISDDRLTRCTSLPPLPRKGSESGETGPSRPRILRKPVRSSISEASTSRPAFNQSHDAPSEKGHSPSVRTSIRRSVARSSIPNTRDLFSQVSTSLTSLANEETTTMTLQTLDQEPPPYVLPQHVPPSDRKRPFSRTSTHLSPREDTVFEMIRQNDAGGLQDQLERGVAVDEIDPESSRTMLSMDLPHASLVSRLTSSCCIIVEAALYRRVHICHVLLHAGCRLHLKDIGQNTALHYASLQGDGKDLTLDQDKKNPC